MTLRDTELIGKKLVKYGCYRSSTDHQNYRIHTSGGACWDEKRHRPVPEDVTSSRREPASA